MTQEELKKLKRVDLLEMLIEQSKENEKLKTKLAQAEKELESRRIAIESSGSMASAALQLNNVFEAAENAKKQYIENLLSMDPAKVNIKNEVRNYCIDIINVAEERKIAVEKETRENCERIVKEAKMKIYRYYAELNGRKSDKK